MSNIQMDLTFRTDVNAPLLTTVLKTLLMQGDDAANVLTVKLYSGAEEVDATGATVSGYLLREDGAKVPLSGSAAGNVVTVNLDEHCYVVAGAFGAYVRLTMGEVKRTILKIAGEIASEGDGPVVDIEEKLVTLEDIIAQMEEMVRVTEAAETATRDANNAAQTANIAAGTADNAAGRANNAAQALEEAPIPTGTVSTYQAGTSPTTPPTGTWQSTVPAVPQGQYLWTRTVQSYTNGNPTTFYSVARQGMDGSGSVASVDGVSPDARGNVPLGAVRSVNGNEPDASGNVTIEAGGGDVQTVNGVAPDDDGNVQITGENVNVSAADQRTVSQAVGQHDQIVRSMTAAEFEALTTEQKAALYAQGVRVVAVDGASYLLNAEGGEALLGLPVGGTAVDSERLGGKDATQYAAKSPNNYAYDGVDLSTVFASAAELHAAVAAGDFSKIRVGDYWPITLNGSYTDYGDNTTQTLSNAIVKMEVAGINQYINYGDTALTVPHLMMCSRDLLPNKTKWRTADTTWTDTSATNPWKGSAIYKTLNTGILPLVTKTDIGAYIFAGPNGNGMRFFGETKAASATAATSWSWLDRGSLFLPTEREIWGQSVWSELTFGAGLALQWPLFAGSLRHVVKGLGNGGSRGGWWLSSSGAGNAYSACIVGSGGDVTDRSASSAFGLALCFLLV